MGWICQNNTSTVCYFCWLLKLWFKGTIFANVIPWELRTFFYCSCCSCSQLLDVTGGWKQKKEDNGTLHLLFPFILPLLKQMIGQQMKPTLLSNQRLAQYSRKIFQKSSVWIKYEHTCEPERRTGSRAVGGFSAGSVWTRVAFLLWRFIVISNISKNDERNSCSQLTQRLSSSITFLTCCKEKINHCGALSGSKQQRAQTQLET